MKNISHALVVGLFLSTGMLAALHAQNSVSPDSPGYQKALAVARVLDDVLRVSRKQYTRQVVEKLANDGTGAALDFKDQKGHVPLPAQFLRRIVYASSQAQAVEQAWRYDVRLRSYWNLNESQSLQGDFEQAGWAFLVNQQQAQRSAGVALKDIKWEPYIEVAQVKGKTALRYFSADIASAASCVSCHNALESTDEVKAKRKKQGVEEGKVFEYDELMGALSITVPIE